MGLYAYLEVGEHAQEYLRGLTEQLGQYPDMSMTVSNPNHITLRHYGTPTREKARTLFAFWEANPITVYPPNSPLLRIGDKLEVWNGAHSPLIIPVGGQLERLAQLRYFLDLIGEEAGLPAGDYELQPHITLARVRFDRSTARHLSDHIKALTESVSTVDEDWIWMADKLHLVYSGTNSGRPMRTLTLPQKM